MESVQSAETPQLSTADHTLAAREYSMVVAAFPMDASQINTAIDYLMAATMNCVALLPVLGGVLECSKKGWLKLFIPQGDDERTADNYFRVFRHLWSSFPHSYKELKAQGFSDASMRYKNIFPFNTRPSLERGSIEEYTPVFSVQANFISGGLLLVVATYRGIIDETWHKTILNVLFSWTPEESCAKLPKTLVYHDPELEKALARDANPNDLSNLLQSCPELSLALTVLQTLSHADSLNRIFRVRRSNVDILRSTVQSSFQDASSFVGISDSDLLATLVWSHITKARYLDSKTTHDDIPWTTTSTIYIPKSFCDCIQPNLTMEYFGSRTVTVAITMPSDTLITACDVTRTKNGREAFTHIAKTVRDRLAAVDDIYVRKRLILGATLSDPRKLKLKFNPFEDVVWNYMGDLAADIKWSIIGTEQNKPTVIRPRTPNNANGVCYVMPTDTLLSKDVFEISICLRDLTAAQLHAMESWTSQTDCIAC